MSEVRERPTVEVETCQECGASLPGSGDCWTRIHELLEIETRILPGLDAETGKRAHFFAVGTYQLQHPSRMTTETLVRLRAAVTEMLAPGARPVERLRQEMGRFANGSQRVIRRAPVGDRSHVPDWPTVWTMTAADVAELPDDSYVEAVEEWARHTTFELDARVPPSRMKAE